jgi:NAD(P)-dependent dehydrogenase (short-subunit alcohol dehydrogenase family)
MPTRTSGPIWPAEGTVGPVALSGSASGIGAAIAARLHADGCRVIGIDLHDADVIADLSTPAGRTAAVTGVRDACDGRLAGLVACAGLGPHVDDWARIVSVNYFGAVALLGGLRDALAAAAPTAAVAVSSNASTIPGMDGGLVAACLAGDEVTAIRLASSLDGQRCYGGTKLALARWVRRTAPTVAWAGTGVRLNAVAPGAVRTPLLDAGLRDATYGDAIRSFPIPLGGFGRPEQIAAAVAFLLSSDASFCCGTILFADGGSDALLRPDEY